MKKLLSLACMLLTVASAFALDIVPGKVYKISNRNDNNMYVKDAGDGVAIAMGALGDNSYWVFEPAGTANHFYVKNKATGRYAQTCPTSAEQTVVMGTTPVEYVVMDCSANEGADCFGFTTTNQSVKNFTSGCIGWNWKNDNTIQTFAAAAGTNHRSFWKVTEVSTLYEGVSISEVTEGGTYFLYNIESGMWMQDNDRRTDMWHTRGQLGTRGIDFKFIADGGAYKLKSPFRSGSFEANDEFNLEGAADNWSFDEVSAKVYRIHHGDHYLGITEGTAYPAYNLYTIDNNNDGKDDNQYYLANNNTNGTWMIVSKEERLAKMANEASEANPVNVTWFISNPDDSNSNERDGDWKRVNHGGLQDFNHEWERGTRVRESWNTDNMSCTQTLTNIPNGIYEFTVQGFYREGENGEIAYNRRKNGEEVHAAKIIANNEVANLMSILDDAVANEEGDYANQKAAEGVWVPRDMWNCHRSMNIKGRYKNAPLRVVVTNNTLTIGVKKDSKPVHGDWVMISEYALAYLGMPADLLTPALENLNAAITAAQGVDEEKLTDAAKTALAGALSTAQGLTESTDVDAIIAATEALSTIINNVKDMDARALKAAIEYMEGRGYNDATASNILSNAVNSSEVNNAVNGLKNRFKLYVSDKSSQPTIYSMPSQSVVGTDDNVAATYVNDHADGYYLYNVGTGRWFCGGDDWGAHAAIGFPGIKITTPEDNWNNGHYNGIVTWLFNGNWGQSGKLGNNGYCDTGGNAWKFWQKDASQGIYTISNNGNDQGVNTSNGCGTKDLMGYNDGTFMRVDVHQADDNNPNNQWIFVTEAQRDEMAQAAMASATADNPVDLTYKIGMPGFNQRERLEGSNQGNDEKLAWTCNHANYKYNASDNGSRHAICERGNNHADFCIDIYGGQWNDAFSWTQTISNLTNGKYRVKVQGYNNRGAVENQAKLIANDQSVVLRQANTEDIIPWVGRLADNTWEAVEYFQNGLYWNEVECYVTDGNLTIGVESPRMTGDHVVLFDNFRLEYISNEIPSVPESMAIRSNGKWGGVAMSEADDSEPLNRHFTATDYFVNDVQQEGIFINFKNGDDWYCPAEGENVVVNAGKEVTEISKLDHEVKGWVVQNQTGYMKVDVYYSLYGMKVVFNDNTLEAMQDVDALYVVGEQTTGWSRESSECPKLEKKADGVYEGTVEIKRDNTVIDAIRIITRPDNGDNDNHIGSLNVPVRYISGEQKLGTGSTGRMYLRKGEQKITVNFNDGTFTVDPVGVAPSYVYAVGTLVDHNWQNTNTAYKLDEIEPNVFKGIVKVAEDGDSRFSLFFERSVNDWNTGRVGPADQSIHPEEGVVATNRIQIGEDRAWRVPAGPWMVTLDIANQTFLYDEIHTQNVVVGDAGYATFVAQYPYTVIPDGAEIKAAQNKETYIHLEPMTEIPAGEAVVIKAAPGTYTFTEANAAKSDVENDLIAATSDIEADGTQYVLANGADGVGFYQVTPATTISAGKGYMIFDGASIKMFYGFDDAETAIDAVATDAAQPSTIYNLRGQRISKVQKGINIVDGKKVVY